MNAHEHDPACIPDSGDDDMARDGGFYSRAFWWMMGLGATGIAASIISTVNLYIAVGKLQVEMSSANTTTANLAAAIDKNYTNLTLMIDGMSRDRYTATTAAADKLDIVQRLSTLEQRIEDNASFITDLRLWQASLNGARTTRTPADK